MIKTKVRKRISEDIIEETTTVVHQIKISEKEKEKDLIDAEVLRLTDQLISKVNNKGKGYPEEILALIETFNQEIEDIIGIEEKTKHHIDLEIDELKKAT